ncbi:hypothetical protein ECG_00964 [Echinococcus granulosus]|nr:hypothetical protein ECG_00964 [Echinococcus granulosus]
MQAKAKAYPHMHIPARPPFYQHGLRSQGKRGRKGDPNRPSCVEETMQNSNHHPMSTGALTCLATHPPFFSVLLSLCDSNSSLSLRRPPPSENDPNR